MRSRRSPRALAVLVATLLVAAPTTAAAQDREADAERLFREGQKLLEERRYGEACPKFEAAYRKDGALGTLLNLAFCHKEQGANWYAWLEFREAEIMATEQNRPDRRDFAKKQLSELEKPLAKIIVDNPRSVPLVEVLVEEKRVPEAEKGVPFAAEPGPRKLTFRWKNDETATLLVKVVKGDRPMHVTAPAHVDAPAEPAASAPSDGIESRASLPAARGESPSTMPMQKTLALGAFGVAAVAGVVMGVTGVMTFTNDCASLGNRDNCKDDDAGRAERDRGETTATIATVSGVIMFAAAAGGAVLWLTAPKTSESPSARAAGRVAIVPNIGPGWAGVGGRF